MTPTPEQIAQWAREAQDEHPDGDCIALTQSEIYRLVTRATAAQAEADAAFADREAKSWPYPSQGNAAASIVATVIRANAPKVTT